MSLTRFIIVGALVALAIGVFVLRNAHFARFDTGQVPDLNVEIGWSKTAVLETLSRIDGTVRIGFRKSVNVQSKGLEQAAFMKSERNIELTVLSLGFFGKSAHFKFSDGILIKKIGRDESALSILKIGDRLPESINSVRRFVEDSSRSIAIVGDGEILQSITPEFSKDRGKILGTDYWSLGKSEGYIFYKLYFLNDKLITATRRNNFGEIP